MMRIVKLISVLLLLPLTGCKHDLAGDTAAAFELLESGHAEVAEAAFRQVILEDPSHARASLGRAHAYAAMQRWPEAYAWYLRTIALDPGNQEGHKGALNLELRSRQWQLALKRFPEIDWQDALARIQALTRIESGLGRTQSALARLEEAAPVYPALLPQAALIAHKMNRESQAMELLESAKKAGIKSAVMAEAQFFIEADSSALRAWIDLHPGNVRLTVLAAEYLLRTGDIRSAADTLLPVKALSSTTPELALLQLEILALQNNQEAMKHFLSSIPGRTPFWEGLRVYSDGLIALSNGRFSEAFAKLKQADVMIPQRGRLQLTIGLLAYAQQNWDDAKIYLSAGLSDLPFVIPARIALAETQLRMGNYDEAVSECLRILRGQPEDRAAHVLLARAMWFQGRNEEALASINRVSADILRPADEVFKGQLLLATDDYAGAEAKLKPYAEENPEALLAYVDSLTAQRRVNEAKTWLSQQSLPTARHVLTILALRQNDSESALSLSAQHTGLPVDKLLHALALEQAGHIEKALAMLRTSSEPALHMKAASLLAVNNELTEARQIYRALLNESPDNPMLLHNLAWVQANLGKDLKAALIKSRRAHLLEPDNSTYRRTLEMITSMIEEKHDELQTTAG